MCFACDMYCDAYRDQALERQCDGGSPGILTWMHDEYTPDTVNSQVGWVLTCDMIPCDVHVVPTCM